MTEYPVSIVGRKLLKLAEQGGCGKRLPGNVKACWLVPIFTGGKSE
jgi:hypothetical protein